MKKLTSSSGVFGPFNNIEILSDRYRCDGTEIPFTVISDGVISDVVDGDFPEPQPEPIDIEAWRETAAITPLQGLLAIDEIGLAAGFSAWASSPDRTFAERAFLDKAQTWRRNDPVLIAGATSLGVDAEQLDGLFMSTLQG